MSACESAAETVQVSPRTVYTWVLDYETLETVSKSGRGQHSKVNSPIVTNPDFKEEFKAHVRECSRVKGTN